MFKTSSRPFTTLTLVMLVKLPTQNLVMTLTCPTGEVSSRLRSPATDPVRLLRSSSVADAVGLKFSGPKLGVLIPLRLLPRHHRYLNFVNRQIPVSFLPISHPSCAEHDLNAHYNATISSRNPLFGLLLPLFCPIRLLQSVNRSVNPSVSGRLGPLDGIL